MKMLTPLRLVNMWLRRQFNKPKWYNMRSTAPISRKFGFDRGLPIGRYYIEKFLSKNKDYIRGRVLEVGDDTYTKKFGTDITSSDVLHYTSGNPRVTLVADLSDLSTLPQEKFDCFICTQTLNFIYDFQEAIKGSHYLLAHGGTLLATVAGLIQISRYDMDRWGDYWRFTTLSLSKAISQVFGKENVDIDSYGNVLTAIAIIEGISSNELTKEELDEKDEDYQIIISAVARKAGT